MRAVIASRKTSGAGRTFLRRLLFLILFLNLAGCSGTALSPVPSPEGNATVKNAFTINPPRSVQDFVTSETLKRLTPSQRHQYRMGPGDILSVQVWNRPEISSKNIVVGPDGTISITRIGTIQVRDRTVQAVTKELTEKLAILYEAPEVTLSIHEFHNNKAFVLGRVTKPGVVNFPGNGTLLEALALAGGLPYQGKETFLTKCAIIRGKEVVIWIDLQDLLNNGNMALNARIMNNDVIFIPEAEDEMVFIMGEVTKPGAIQLKRGLNLLDSIMLAGGITPAANPEKIFILRQQGTRGNIKPVNLKKILETGDFKQNYALTPGDVVYVSPSGMKKFNYALEQILPTLRVLDLSTSILYRSNLLDELTEEVLGIDDDETD